MNLRWLVRLLLLVIILPLTVLTGIGTVVLIYQERVPNLVLGILVVTFAAMVLAGAGLLVVLADRGARLARVQETFLSHMGHELLTPLSGIQLHTQILGGIELPEEAAGSVAAIQKESRRLQDLVERILGWRQIRSRRHLYRRTVTTVEEVVARVLQRIPSADALKVRVVHPEARFKADPEALAEAVLNLVNNATKYAPEGGPIELVARRFGRRIIFAVYDRGPGLPPVPVERLFEPFSRWIARDAPDPGGSGLGLAITRQIARDHGGELAASARPGRGSRFYISLPVSE